MLQGPLTRNDLAEAERQFRQDLEKRQISLARSNVVIGRASDGSWPRANAANKGRSGRGDAQYVYDTDGWPRWTIINYTDSLGWESSYYQKTDRPLTQEEQEQIDRAIAANRREQEEAKARQQAAWERVAMACRQRFEAAKPANAEHAYLVKKSIGTYDIRQEGDTLLIPLYGDDGLIWSLQTISTSGSKLYAKGSRVRGSLYVIPAEQADVSRETPRVYVAEGFATAATIAELTGCAVIVAFASNKVMEAGEYARNLWPDSELIFAADDDWKTVVNGKPMNPGMEAATKAAIALEGLVAVPDFSGVIRNEKDTDFNDMRRVRGDEPTRTALSNAVRPDRLPNGTVTPNNDEEPPKSRAKLTLNDFYAHMPTHTFIFIPTREMWPKTSVDARLGKKASSWLDKNRPVEQTTWAPGLPMIIRDRLTSEGGWIDREGVNCFNFYRPPTLTPGNAAGAEKWLQHVRNIYPDYAERIVLWLAHRVQRPGQKLNHALVLGGEPGIGKDSILEPVKIAIGPWNFQETTPVSLLGRFNGFLKSVILRVSEARDMGDVDRYQFYDHTKILLAAPPDVLRIDEKNTREYSIVNAVGVIMTTNHRDALYMPADDRRHYMTWSEMTAGTLSVSYFNELYQYYEQGGAADVMAYLLALDLSGFDPKAPPPKTEAFWAAVNAGRSNDDAELEDVLERLGKPPVLTLAMVLAEAADSDFARWLSDRKSARVIPHRMENAGYVPVNNPDSKQGLWRLPINAAGATKRQMIYGRTDLSVRERLDAAMVMARATQPEVRDTVSDELPPF